MTIHVNMKELTIREIAAVSRILHDELGMSMAELMESPEQILSTAAFATVVMRRTDPDYAFAQACELPVGDVVVENDAPPTDASNGLEPRPSLASGV